MILVITLKKFYKVFGIVAIMLFSFYYTEKIALLMRQKDPIYETIEVVKKDSNINFVNAEIDEETIVPGMNGLSVNTEKSFQKMKSFGAFNKYYLIFDQVKPEISLEDNKDKIIKEGNKKKKSVAIVLANTGEISNYLKNNQIKATILINKDTFQRDSFFEQINYDNRFMKETDGLLNSIHQNKNICVLNQYNTEACKKDQKYLVKPEVELTGTNVALVKGKIESGTILMIQQNAKLEDFKLLLNQVKSKGLNLVTLSELILEEREPEKN